MTVEVTGGALTQQFDKFTKKLAAKEKGKGERKREMAREWAKYPEISTRFNSEDYRTGWDRIFGKEKRDSLPEPDQTDHRAAAADLGDQGATGGDSR